MSESTEARFAEFEAWKSVLGWPKYEVSSMGAVRRGGRELKQATMKNGYLMVSLVDCGPRKYATVHRLVVQAFHGAIPDGMDVCHNNGIRSDNRLTNLRIDTRSGNMKDAVLHGTSNRGERCGTNKYTAEFVLSLRSRLDAGEYIPKISVELGIPKPTLYAIRSRQTWFWL
jgi:hypothetical protein